MGHVAAELRKGDLSMWVLFFTNKGLSFIHRWTRIDLPVNFPAKV